MKLGVPMTLGPEDDDDLLRYDDTRLNFLQLLGLAAGGVLAAFCIWLGYTLIVLALGETVWP